MGANTAINRQAIACYGPDAEIPGLKVIYTSADMPDRPLPDQAMQMVNACRVLNADTVAIESDDHVIIAAVNGYDDAHAVAVCDPDVSLSAIARILHVRLLSLAVSERQSDILPVATVRMTIRRWERRIAAIFGVKYAAGLVDSAMAAISPDAVTTEDMEKIRRALLSAVGGCIDLPA